jgi:hypothetical protein
MLAAYTDSSLRSLSSQQAMPQTIGHNDLTAAGVLHHSPGITTHFFARFRY